MTENNFSTANNNDTSTVDENEIVTVLRVQCAKAEAEVESYRLACTQELETLRSRISILESALTAGMMKAAEMDLWMTSHIDGTVAELKEFLAQRRYGE